MITIERLHKAYDDTVALRDIDLTIKEGAITGLLGPNGAGKTTLVSILTGIIKKSGGHVLINGLDLDGNLAEIQSLSSIVPQTLAFYPLLTAYENLEYFGVLYGLHGSLLKERIDYSIEVASLQSFYRKRAGKFSGGLKRRLNFAIGLLNNPKILYLDEPTVGVDAQSRNYILEMIRKLNKEEGTTVIYTSHYIDEIEHISDEITIIDEGSIILRGPKETILASSDAFAIQIPETELNGMIGSYIKDVPGVFCTGNSIVIEKNDQYLNSFIHILTALRDGNISIQNIRYNANRLEDLFLRLTSKNLRDEE
ncbi:MAG: ABC transporter ATP-binding protein [Spirochaetes bacterium]|nr:ABC transporter ATP-binding protein [Spirochaetota bacterium]